MGPGLAFLQGCLTFKSEGRAMRCLEGTVQSGREVETLLYYYNNFNQQL